MSFDLFGITMNLYGALIGLAFLIGLFLMSFLARERGLDKDVAYELFLIIFPLAIIGARLYYIAFSDLPWNFNSIISLQDGGLAIYGGVILGFLGIAVYSHFKKISLVKLTDIVVPALILGQAIGRWGNYFNQEAYGYIVNNPALQWFPFAVFVNNNWHMATFFYESLWNIIGFFILLIIFSRTKRNGFMTGAYLIFYGVGRAVIEGFRTDSLYVGASEVIRVSQVFSVILVIIGIVMVLLARKNKFE